MQDKDLAAVITTQGDATGSGSLRSARSVQAMGLDTLPLEQSGMQGYVVDGGKVVYQKTGAGPAGIHAFLGRARCDAAQRGGQFLHNRGRRRTEPQPSGRQCAGVRQGAGPRHPVHQFLHAPRIQRIYGMMQKAAGRALCTPGRFVMEGTPAYGARVFCGNGDVRGSKQHGKRKPAASGAEKGRSAKRSGRAAQPAAARTGLRGAEIQQPEYPVQYEQRTGAGQPRDEAFRRGKTEFRKAGVEYHQKHASIAACLFSQAEDAACAGRLRVLFAAAYTALGMSSSNTMPRPNQLIQFIGEFLFYGLKQAHHPLRAEYHAAGDNATGSRAAPPVSQKHSRGEAHGGGNTLPVLSKMAGTVITASTA